MWSLKATFIWNFIDVIKELKKKWSIKFNIEETPKLPYTKHSFLLYWGQLSNTWVQIRVYNAPVIRGVRLV